MGQPPPAAPLWETTVVEFSTPRATSSTSSSTPLGDDSCGVFNTQSHIKHLQQHPSGRRQLWSLQHPEPDQAPPAAPLWETTVVESSTPRARSSTSSSTPLGDDSCGVFNTQSQIKHLQQHPSGRRQLWSFQHPEPHQAPPAAPLWETTVVEFSTPRATSTTSSSTPLGDDSGGVFNTQSHINHLQQHPS